MEGQTNQDPNTADAYATIPNQVYGYEAGAGSPRQNALLYQLENDNVQAELAATGGSRRHSRKYRMSRKPRQSHRSRHSRRQHKRVVGGQAAGTEMVVPSFPQTGPATSPLNPTSASVVANQAALDAKVSACNDCYATGTCDQSMGCPQQGGRRNRNRHRKSHKKPKTGCASKSLRNKPFTVSPKRVKKSPFKSLASVRNTLKAYRKGRKIGFTQRSSLRSMGLIPRKSGGYKLGCKYANL